MAKDKTGKNREQKIYLFKEDGESLVYHTILYITRRTVKKCHFSKGLGHKKGFLKSLTKMDSSKFLAFKAKSTPMT